MATNLDIQAQINALLEDQNKLLEESAKLTRDQLTVTRDLMSALKGVNFKDVTEDAQRAQQAVQGVSGATQNYGNTNQDVFEKVNKSLQEAVKNEEKAGHGLEDLGKKVKRFAIAASAIDGFVQGLRFTHNMMSNIISLGTGLVGTLGHIGASIISIPFKMLSGLIHMAGSGGGSSELQQALEDIRKEFGSLRETSGRAVVDMAKNMKGELAQTGLRVGKIFGTLAERLKTMQEYAHNLGPLFATLAGQFVKNAEAIGAYYKGLGLTEEAQKAVATRSYALGTAVTEELRQIANYSLQLSKAFNGTAGSAKEISRDMGTLMADFKHFGGIATKEIAQSVVYFRRLGVEVTKVLGVIDKYDNFEDAAEGAAHLSQAFGLNVDALELMKAQNPAQRVEMLRKSFFAAGRSVENMTRQERALLAQQTGLDDSALDLVFSMKNQSQSYDQVTKKADQAKKKQLTQAEAMEKLADSIERLVRSGGGMGSGGFLDRFLQGFTIGIQRSSEFRKIMRNLRTDLRIAYTEGIKVGKAFVQMFPGVKEVFKGIADLFEPKRFREMFRKVTESFKIFFKEMTTDPERALPKLLENLKKNFFSWFQGNSQNGQRILEGFKKFFMAISQIAGSLLKIALTGIRKGIEAITDLISGKASLSLKGGKGALGFVGQLFSPILKAIVEVGPSLWMAVKGLFSELWKKAEPWLKNNLVKIMGVLFGPALVGVIGRTIATSLTAGVVGGIFNWVKGGGLGKAIQGVSGMFSKQMAGVSEAVSKIPKVGHGGAGAGGVAAEAIKGANQAGEAANQSKITAGTIAKMGLLTLFIVAGMTALLFAIFEFAKAMKENHLSVANILTASAAMIATSVAMLGIAGAVKLLSTININPGMLLKITIGLAVVGGVAALMALGAVEIVKQFAEIQASKLSKTALIMAATGTFFLAAGGVVAIAALVGGVALTGFGALAIAAGLAAIAATTEVMAEQGIRIMKAIDAFHPSPGFVEKSKIFVEVLKGVGAFAGAVAQMTAATRPGLLDFLRGAGAEEQRATLKQVEKTIQTLGDQLVKIVETVRSSIQMLKGSEQELKSAQILGDVIGGVGNLGAALRPPTEALAEPGFFARVLGADGPEQNIAAITHYVSVVSLSLRGFLSTVTGMLTGQLKNGFTEEQKRAAEAIPSILNAVGQLGRSLIPDSETLKQLNKTDTFAGSLVILGGFVQTLLASLQQSKLFTFIGELFTTMTQSLKNLSPSELKSLQSLAPLVAPALKTVADIAGVIANLALPENAGKTGMNTGALFQLNQVIGSFFTRAKEDIPALISAMRTTFAGLTVNEANTLSKGLEGVAKVFDVLGSVPKIIQGLQEMHAPGANGQRAAANIEDVKGMLILLGNLILGTGDTQGFGMIEIIKVLTNSLTQITSSISNPAEFSKSLDGLKTIFDILAGIPGMLKNLAGETGGTGLLAPDLLATPLLNLASLVTALGQPMIGNVANPLVGGLLGQMLSRVKGVTSAQKGMILGTVDSILEITRGLTGLTGSTIPDASGEIRLAMSHANANLFALAEQLIPDGEGNFASNLGAVGPLVRSATQMIEKASITKLASVVTDMVAEVNSLSTQIRGLKPVNIETSLQSLGDNIGLGANGSYTIQNRNFNVVVNFTVAFDNNGLDAFELALLRRPGPHITRIAHGDLTQ